MKVNELLIGIHKKDIVLPEFQREYVWSLEQSKQLMVSLFNGYPVGALLFWTTDTPPEIKNYAVNPKKIGTITIILDGQQRLTTLYILLKNEMYSFAALLSQLPSIATNSRSSFPKNFLISTSIFSEKAGFDEGIVTISFLKNLL